MSSVKDLAIDSPHPDEPIKYAQTLPAQDDLYEDGTVDPVYEAKAKLLNGAIQEIGMGRYQVRSVHLLCYAMLRYV